ncbi:MAG: foldase, partial [Deltaproteobacteria bacterium]
AREYSQSPDRENGGALGYFSAGQLPAEFDAVLFKLPVKQVSTPVESPYGFHLFLVERRRKAGLRPYAAVKAEIATKLYQQKEETAFHLWLENLQKTTVTNINWELLQPELKP